jgi:hypothetical protein
MSGSAGGGNAHELLFQIVEGRRVFEIVARSVVLVPRPGSGAAGGHHARRQDTLLIMRTKIGDINVSARDIPNIPAYGSG